MHLLVAAHDLYPDPGSGGTGRFVFETGQRLVDRGHQVTVLTRRRGDVPRRDSVAGMAVYRIDLSVAGESGPRIVSQVPLAARTVRTAIRRADPDLLSLQGPVVGQLTDGLAPDGLPRSCTFHSPWPTEYEIRTRDGDLPAWRRRANVALRKALEECLLDRTDQVQTLSRYMRQELRDTYGPTDEPCVVPGGVDHERFHPGADASTSDESTATSEFRRDDTAILTVRRLSPRMGHDVLLAAFATLADRDSDVHLYLAGDGPLRADLEVLAADLGITDRTTFLGYVPDDALPAVQARADLAVVPTTELEGFGLATLEALASGTPVVATPVGGTVEVLAGVERRDDIPEPMLADAPEPAALETRLAAWATLDRDRRERAGAVCRRYAVETYPWERTVDALERRYQSTLATEEDPADGHVTDADDGGPRTGRRWQVQR